MKNLKKLKKIFIVWIIEQNVKRNREHFMKNKISPDFQLPKRIKKEEEFQKGSRARKSWMIFKRCVKLENYYSLKILLKRMIKNRI